MLPPEAPLMLTTGNDEGIATRTQTHLRVYFYLVQSPVFKEP